MAVFHDSHRMPSHISSSFYLSIIFIRYSTTHIISTIPLKSTSGIICIYSSFFLPITKRHGSIYPKEIELGVFLEWGKFSIGKPICWKFILAICHVFTSKHACFQHLCRAKIGVEPFIKVFTHGLGAFINIVSLHLIIYGDNLGLHE